MRQKGLSEVFQWSKEGFRYSIAKRKKNNTTGFCPFRTLDYTMESLFLCEHLNIDMENNSLYNKVAFEDIPYEVNVKYADGDIILLDDIRSIPDTRQKMLKLDFTLLLVCLQGKLQVNMKAKALNIHPYDILCCHSNIMLEDCMISPDFEARILCLSPRIIQNIFHTDKTIWKNYFYINDNPVFHIGKERSEIFDHYCCLLDYRIKHSDHIYNKEAMSALIRAMLYDLLADLTQQTVPIQKDNNMLTHSDILFRRFIDLLSSEVFHKRSVTYYAEKLCITPKYLSTAIKEASGKTAYAWINQYIIEDIKYQLKYSDKSIKEVAELLSFENHSFFGKYVRKHLGCSPTEYRKKLGS